MASLENFRLIVFRTVAEQHSFRKAAEELYLTQPAVSLQVKALEEELGVQLLDRSGAHVSLTEAGRILLEFSKKAGALLARAQEEIAALSGDHAGKLALGASTTIAQYVLPRMLGEFRRKHPRVEITLVSGNTEHIVEAVEKQQIALGFIEGPPRSREVNAEPFLDDELVLIASTAHELAERGTASAAEIARIPLLMRERGSGTRHVVELALERLGLKRNTLNVVMELDSTEAIKSAVEAGLGIGFVSRWAIGKDVRLDSGFKIVEVKGMKIKRQFLAVCAKGVAPHAAAAEFQRFLIHRAPTRALHERLLRTQSKGS